jgi:PPOX class probable F420-dependent enzyme
VAGIALPQAARDLLESDAVAHVVTLDEDGGPQVTAAWVGLDGDEIVFATLPDQRKLRNLRRDPRIALSIPSTTTNEWGLLEYLVVYGTARVTEGGAAEVLQRLAHTYLGPDVIFPGMPDPPSGVCHQDHARAPRRRRAVEPTPPLNVANRTVRQAHPSRQRSRYRSRRCVPSWSRSSVNRLGSGQNRISLDIDHWRCHSQ